MIIRSCQKYLLRKVVFYFYCLLYIDVSFPVGGIVGAVIGALILTLILAGVLWYRKKQKARSAYDQPRRLVSSPSVVSLFHDLEVINLLNGIHHLVGTIDPHAKRF